MHTAARARPQIAPTLPTLVGSPLRVQLHGVPLWFYQGPHHPTRLGSYQAPGRAGFRSTLYAVPLQSAPVSHKRPALSLISMCSTAISRHCFSPRPLTLPVPPHCTTCLTARAASFHPCHTCTASRGSFTREPFPPKPPLRLTHELRKGGHALYIMESRGARFRFLDNATRESARLFRGWPGERSSWTSMSRSVLHGGKGFLRSGSGGGGETAALLTPSLARLIVIF